MLPCDETCVLEEARVSRYPSCNRGELTCGRELAGEREGEGDQIGAETGEKSISQNINKLEA